MNNHKQPPFYAIEIYANHRILPHRTTYSYEIKVQDIDNDGILIIRPFTTNPSDQYENDTKAYEAAKTYLKHKLNGEPNE